MYAKKIKFTDFNGKEREQTFYFNLTKAELAEMHLSKEGGLKEYVERIVESQKTSEIAEVFKKLILKAYGEKSDDGMCFIKHDSRGNLADMFEQTEAYSELFMELATNDKAGAEFISGIVSNKLRALMEQGVANGTIDPNHPALKK